MPASLSIQSDMNVSARNVFTATVQSVRPGTVNAEVTLQTVGGHTLVAVVTGGSVRHLDLKPGRPVRALVKASWVMLTVGESPALSARNRLRGTVHSLQTSTVTTEVGLRLDDGAMVYAVVTHQAVEALRLAPGQTATAVIKASDVVLAVNTVE